MTVAPVNLHTAERDEKMGLVVEADGPARTRCSIYLPIRGFSIEDDIHGFLFGNTTTNAWQGELEVAENLKTSPSLLHIKVKSVRKMIQVGSSSHMRRGMLDEI